MTLILPGRRQGFINKFKMLKHLYHSICFYNSYGKNLSTYILYFRQYSKCWGAVSEQERQQSLKGDSTLEIVLEEINFVRLTFCI